MPGVPKKLSHSIYHVCFDTAYKWSKTFITFSVINEDIDDGLLDGDKDEAVPTTEIYDVIINDRAKSDIIINEQNNNTEPTKENDIKKLLAAQAHAIEVLNMIDHLETEMKVQTIHSIQNKINPSYCMQINVLCYDLILNYF